MSSALRPLLFRRRLLVSLVLAVGIVLSLLIFHYATEREREFVATELARRSDVRGALTREVVSNFESSLFGLSNLFTGSDDVTAAEFRTAARRVLQRYPGISALEWVQIVPEAERTDVERALSRQAGHPFTFRAPAADGAMAPAGPAAVHYPILYVEPMAGNERAFGYDLAFGPTLDALRSAAATGRMAVSRRLRLVQEAQPERYSVIFIWPVLKPTAAGDRCIGFVQGVFRLDDILIRSLHMPRNYQALDTLYVDPAAADPAERVFLYHPAESTGAAPAPAGIEDDFRRGLHRQTSLAVGDRTWTILFRPSATWLASVNHSHAWWFLLSGLTVTGLLAALIHVLGRRHETIEREVELRTAELKESRRYLESFVQALPGMAYRCGLSHQSVMLYTSDGAAELTGYTAEDFRSGRVHIRDLIHPDDIGLVRQLTHEALHEKRLYEFEYRIRTRDGHEKWVLSRGRGVYDDDEKLLFFEGLAIDITARKRAEGDKLTIERRLLESQKLESLGLLASGVAHDFNNLLTTIVGNAGLARLDTGQGTPAAGCLEQIELAAQHAAELCQQMLAYAGKGRLTVDRIDLGALLSGLKPLLQSSVSRTARLEFEIAPDLPRITGDASQIRQIIMNLVINASDAIGEAGGRIAIAAKVQDVAAAELELCATGRELAAGRYVVVEVRDSGRGMSPATLTRIFDPFFTTKFAGRGLGLAAVLGIIRGHNGALRVTSRIGEGSAFKLILPAAEAPAAPESAATPAGVRRALIVDDDEPVRAVAAELLHSMDYETVAAAGGTEALALFTADPGRYSFVLLDIVMPGMDGLELLQRLRAVRAGVRVLLMSGHADRGRMLELAAEGRVAYLTKPFNRAALESTLRELFTD